MDRDLPGGAKLYVPDGLRGEAPLCVHLHGGVKDAFIASQLPGAVVSLSLNGLSGVYTAYFQKTPAQTFQKLLDDATKAAGVTSWSRVWLSSFSAGFGGVREILRAPESFHRVDALILADTLYAGFARAQNSPEDRPAPDPANLKDFARFAREAAAGRKAMLVTCCDLIPPTYSATRETAYALCDSVSATRRAIREEWPDGMTRTAEARVGRFAFHGFDGDDGKAHMRHLHGLRYFWRMVPRA